jgi:hypothetical protein
MAERGSVMEGVAGVAGSLDSNFNAMSSVVNHA